MIEPDLTKSVFPSGMTETQLQSAIIELAQYLGWRVAHFRAARVKCRACSHDGWHTAYQRCEVCKGRGYSYRTPVEADGEGFLDLVLVRDRVIYAECKVKGRKPTQKQREWYEALNAAGQEVYLWREGDWLEGEVEKVLRRRA